MDDQALANRLLPYILPYIPIVSNAIPPAIEQRLQSLEARVHAIIIEMSGLQSHVSALQDEVSIQRQVLTQTRDELGSLEQVVDQLSKSVGDLETQVDGVESELALVPNEYNPPLVRTGRKLALTIDGTMSVKAGALTVPDLPLLKSDILTISTRVDAIDSTLNSRLPTRYSGPIVFNRIGDDNVISVKLTSDFFVNPSSELSVSAAISDSVVRSNTNAQRITTLEGQPFVVEGSNAQEVERLPTGYARLRDSSVLTSALSSVTTLLARPWIASVTAPLQMVGSDTSKALSLTMNPRDITSSAAGLELSAARVTQIDNAKPFDSVAAPLKIDARTLSLDVSPRDFSITTGTLYSNIAGTTGSCQIESAQIRWYDAAGTYFTRDVRSHGMMVVRYGGGIICHITAYVDLGANRTFGRIHWLWTDATISQKKGCYEGKSNAQIISDIAPPPELKIAGQMVVHSSADPISTVPLINALTTATTQSVQFSHIDSNVTRPGRYITLVGTMSWWRPVT
ncbi:hypothetical protein [Reovirus GCRV104]|nr:hypothetical protein [Reovirus GCRV104]